MECDASDDRRHVRDKYTRTIKLKYDAGVWKGMPVECLQHKGDSDSVDSLPFEAQKQIV